MCSTSFADHRNRSDGFLDNAFLVEIEQLA